MSPSSEGLDHLLPDGRGAGGRNGAESEELKAACFMGIVSLLASTPQVLRVSPLHRSKIHNAVAASVIQAGTIDTTQKPLTDAGLDGTGEVIQVHDRALYECCSIADRGVLVWYDILVGSHVLKLVALGFWRKRVATVLYPYRPEQLTLLCPYESSSVFHPPRSCGQ